MIDRRSFTGGLVVLAATKVVSAVPLPRVRNVVLVHGAYADGSCWAEVIPHLQARGLNVTAVQNPLNSLAEDCDYTRRAIALQDGPTVLVAHSYGGEVITETGVDPKVSALVYCAARAPDVGEDYTALAKRFPAPPASQGLAPFRRLCEAQRDGLSTRFCRRYRSGEGAHPLCGPGADLRYIVQCARHSGRLA